jgi:hypothetical protein
VSNAIARRENRTLPLTRAEALRRLGDGGFRIATLGNRIVALATWDAENLVATIRDIWVESGDTAPVVLPKVFGLVEQEARALLCEVVLQLIDGSALTVAAEAKAAGYREADVSSLHPVWQGVARDRLRPSQQIWIKRLRDDITTKPV